MIWRSYKAICKPCNNAAAAAAAKSLQLCLTLCNPIDGSPPGSPVPGILQARTLEWVAISFSNACKWKVKVKSISRVQLLVTPWTAAYQAPPSMGFSRQEYWSGVPLPSPVSKWMKAQCSSLFWVFLQPTLSLFFKIENFIFYWGSGGLVAKSCLTLCNPIDCSPPDSSVHGILQGSILQWVAISFSRGSSQPSWLTALRWFQVDREGTQPYIYMYPFSPKLPFHQGCHITLSRVPCGIQ